MYNFDFRVKGSFYKLYDQPALLISNQLYYNHLKIIFHNLYNFEGANCVIDMLRKLIRIGFTCIREMKQNAELDLTIEDQINVNNADAWYLFNECFTEKHYQVRDRCHRTGKFRGACRNQCDIKY